MRRKVLLLAAIAACGGKAVIDEPLGSGGLGPGGGPPDDDGSPLCFTPAPVGEVSVCDGTSGAGAGAPLECSTTVCDSQANLWTSKCKGDTCECIFNFDQACFCTINEPGNTFCAGIPSCCPAPFPP